MSCKFSTRLRRHEHNYFLMKFIERYVVRPKDMKMRYKCLTYLRSFYLETFKICPVSFLEIHAFIKQDYIDF